MKESQIREHLLKGWVRCIVTFEIVGKPAKYVENALVEYIDNIKKDHRIIIINEEHLPAEEVEESMFSAIAEEEMLVMNLETLTWLAINFSPASIEILDPDELVMPARDITNWLNDLLANLHEVSLNVRGSKNSVDHLTVAMNQLIQNAILLSVKSGGKNEAQISEDIGIYHEQIVPFLEHMTKKGKLNLNNGVYAVGNGMPLEMSNALSAIGKTRIGDRIVVKQENSSREAVSQKDTKDENSDARPAARREDKSKKKKR